MTLVGDYLEKTAEKVKDRQKAQVPPLLRRTRRRRFSAAAVFKLGMGTMVILGAVLLGAYAYRTVSFLNTDKGPPELWQNPSQENPTAPSRMDAKSETGLLTDRSAGKPPPAPDQGATGKGASAKEIFPKIASQVFPDTDKLISRLSTAVLHPPARQRAPQEHHAVSTRWHPAPAMVDTGPNADHFFNAGLSTQREGNLRGAIIFYEKALDLDPGHRKALLNLSAAYIRTGRDRSARDLLERLRKQEGDSVDVMINMGILCLNQAKYQDAEVYLEKAVRSQPGNTTALYNLAYLNLVQQRYEKAEKLFGRVSSLDPENTQALLSRASIYEKQKNYADALKCYVRSLDTTKVQASDQLKSQILSRIQLLQTLMAEGRKSLPIPAKNKGAAT
jgi:tetratricopeptide (TPR) repeat protein